jgi:branched-chain amino acid transport system substrate-binding protein
MRKTFKATLIASAFTMLGMTSVAHADINIGVVMSLTGPGSGLGIPTNNGFKLWPETIGGEKVNLITLDDATDPTQAAKSARRLVEENKVDLIIGSASVPATLAVADVARETQTVQLAISPIELPEGKDTWTFRLPQATGVMAEGVVNHMKAHGVKTFAFLGYSDAYGEVWLKEMKRLASQAGITLTTAERFGRADTSVTAQALHVIASNPDAVLVVASGSGAAMPHKTLIERGYKGKIYQTHSAASRDLIRLGGKDVEGAFVISGPAVVPEALPDSSPSKKLATDYVARYEKIFNTGTRNQFGAHIYDANIVLQKAVPLALKKAKPGTPEFRSALRDALENIGATPISQGVIHYTAKDHFGIGEDGRIMLTIQNANWKAAN